MCRRVSTGQKVSVLTTRWQRGWWLRLSGSVEPIPALPRLRGWGRVLQLRPLRLQIIYPGGPLPLFYLRAEGEMGREVAAARQSPECQGPAAKQAIQEVFQLAHQKLFLTPH